MIFGLSIGLADLNQKDCESRAVLQIRHFEKKSRQKLKDSTKIYLQHEQK